MNDSKNLENENVTTVVTPSNENVEKELTVKDFSEETSKDVLVMKYMTKEHVLDVMSVPSFSYSEYRMVTYLILWCRARNIEYEFDDYGNIYLTKGTLNDGEYYPCVTSHLDTVQDKQKSYAEAGMRIPIKETVEKGKHKIYVDGMGIGADCRAGITICLAMVEKFDKIKACFFLQEEVGMLGSAHLKKSWFDNVGYVIGYDSPELNRAAWKCSGEKLFDKDFYTNHLEAICDKWGLNDFRAEPITDVVQIRRKTDITCMNFGNGGYNAHLTNEYCYLEDMDHACGMGMEIVEHLGCNKYACDGTNAYTDGAFYDKKAGRSSTTYYNAGTYHYSGGTVTHTTTSTKTTTTPSTTPKKSDTVSVDAVKYISEIYEKRIESIKNAVKEQCEKLGVDFADNFEALFKEEIRF